MKAHYTFLGELGLNTDEQKLFTAFGLMLILFFLGKIAASKLRGGAATKQLIIPEKKVTLFGVFDFLIEALLNYVDSIIGKENRKHFPFIATIFFFLLTSNFLGLVPGMAAITTTVQINVAIALIVFLYFNYYAIKNQGIKGFLKHLCGPIPVLAIILFPVEVFGLLLRPITLNLRLYWNINADHQVLSIFTDQFGFGLIGLPFYALGMFVAFMQAFIFTTLTMVYILFAVQHEEGH